MHSSQTNLINNNLHKLITLTSCNVELVTCLQSKNVISGIEAEALLLSHTPNMVRANELYKLVQTKSNSFSKLLEALKTTKQTGAWNVLNTSEDVSKYKVILVAEENILEWTSHGCSVYKGHFGTRPSIIKVYPNILPGSIDAAVREMKVLTRIDWHENIARCFVGKYISFGSQHSFAVAFSELLPIPAYFEKVGKENLKKNLQKNLCKQLIKGVHFLHKSHILHLDLSLQSIFVSSLNSDEQQIKIGEFGVSQQLQNTDCTVKVSLKSLRDKGVGAFFTPEVILQEEKLRIQKQRDASAQVDVGYETDVFCAGTILYFFLSGGIEPFGSLLSRMKHLMKNKIDWDNIDWNSCTKMEKIELTLMLDKNPSQRPTISKLAETYLKGSM